MLVTIQVEKICSDIVDKQCSCDSQRARDSLGNQTFSPICERPLDPLLQIWTTASFVPEIFQSSRLILPILGNHSVDRKSRFGPPPKWRPKTESIRIHCNTKEPNVRQCHINHPLSRWGFRPSRFSLRQPSFSIHYQHPNICHRNTRPLFQPSVTINTYTCRPTPDFHPPKKRNIFNWVFYSWNSFTHSIQLGVSCHIFLDNIWHNFCCCKFCKFSSACLWWLQKSSDGTEEQKDGGGRFPLPPYCFHLHHQLLHQNVGAFHFILLFDSLHLPRLPLCMTCLWCKIILSFLFISERHMHNCCYYPSQIYWSCCCSFFTFCLPFLECIYFSDEIIFFRFVELRRSVFKVVNLGAAGFRCCWFPHERCKERPLKWFSQLGADIDRTGGLPSTNTVFILVCELQICNSQIFPRDGWTSYSLTVAVG